MEETCQEFINDLPIKSYKINIITVKNIGETLCLRTELN